MECWSALDLLHATVLRMIVSHRCIVRLPQVLRPLIQIEWVGIAQQRKYTQYWANNARVRSSIDIFHMLVYPFNRRVSQGANVFYLYLKLAGSVEFKFIW